MKVEEAAKFLKVDVMTMRLFLRNGHYGFAVKGTGSRYIYRVDEEKVRKEVEYAKTVGSAEGGTGAHG